MAQSSAERTVIVNGESRLVFVAPIPTSAQRTVLVTED